MDDVFEEESEQTVTIHEYLNDVEERELEADLVLGGDDGKECTYNKGYMKRQAIFSCLTCTPDGNAGFCTACSLSCHDGHEIPRDDKDEPLYEDFICQACVVICSFLTLYPRTIWIPLRPSDARLSTSKESNVLGDALSASSSSARVDSSICSLEPSKSDPSLINTDTEKIPGEKGGSLRELSEKNIGLGGNASVDAPSICSSGKLENGSSSSHSQRKDCSLPLCEFVNEASKEGVLLAEIPLKTMGLNKCSQNAGASSKCMLGVDLRVAPLLLEKEKPLFLSKNWRDVLCRCESCIEFYTHKGIGFLIDREDSIIEYEKVAKQKREEKLHQQEGVELNFLNGLGHVQKIEILNGIADMQNELRSFLVSSDPSKPITSADVHQFFENLSKKRRRIL
ncbi:putative E3 ubiquitin-protein ligase UBR7 isoform X2 [Telopea speciosissima]|uniref:putative E3 ubiquitin-protein ligase UBR7 isoform X2 n=1 Tax=Telopea speciosissima TaxID=54955 RepID=UPI001CC68574|nr:putative E3 ubiquitin-protein ligase UBR7 isoform X2 [Telopea speciosissima]